MRWCKPFVLLCLAAGCDSASNEAIDSAAAPDISVPGGSGDDLAGPAGEVDAGRDAAGVGEGPADLSVVGPVADLSVGGEDAGPGGQRPPKALNGVVVLGAGAAFVDASTDQGGNVWGVTSSTVYFYKKGGGQPFSFGPANGLARGKTTWVDTYWFGSVQSPSVEQVYFSAVAGGVSGQAFIGNIGYIGDRLQIDPDTGAIRSVEGLEVTKLQQPNPDELIAQQQREVATWHAVIDLNGTYSGATYFGGWHGTSALYNMTKAHASGSCGCYDYQQHIHPFLPNGNALGGDVHALTITSLGDVWIGDRRAIYFLPQASLGPTTDLFQNFDGAPTMIPGRPGVSYLVPFPQAPNGDNWVFGLAVDARGGIYVASAGNGLAYLAAGTYAATYWSKGNQLPTNQLTGVDIDRNGEVWIATQASGVVRYTPGLGLFTNYTNASGLPSNGIRQVYVDKYDGKTRRVYFATDNGIAVYAGP